MKLLLENKLLESTITGINTSNNYPAENLIHPWLKKRTQTSMDTDTLTFTLDSQPQSFSDLWFGFTNADSITVEFKNNIGTVIHTITNSSLTDWIYHYSFAEISGIYTIDVTYSGDPDCYLGGVGAGIAEELPDALNNFRERRINKTDLTDSPDNQLSRNYKKSTWFKEWRFKNLSRETLNEYVEFFEDIGINFPIWVDFFDLNHDYEKPGYGALSKPVTWRKDGKVFDFSFSMKEAR